MGADVVTETQKILLSVLLSTVISATVGYYTAREQASIQVNRLEERQANQYSELRGMILSSQAASERNFESVRQDFNGVRGEIMTILRGRRP